MAKKKQTVLDELSRVRFVGPARAQSLYEDHGIRSIAGLVQFGEQGKLDDLKGVGEKKASTILSSARRIAESNGKDKEAEQEPEKKASAGANGATAPAKEPQKKQEEEKAPSTPTPTPQQPATPRSEARRTAGRASAPTSSAAAGESRIPESGPRAAPDDRQLTQRFIDTLRCPACGHDRFDIGAASLTCQACHRQFSTKDGIVDLAPPATADRSLSQKVMESRFYAQFYEELMRPRLTSIVSKRTMREEYRLAAEFLDFDDDIRLLDVGCGTANFTRYFAQRIGLAETRATSANLPLVVGMDLSWPMLEHARRNIRQENLEGKVFLVRGDATRIPVRRGAFNRLHCAGSLHMMNDIDESLRNFARVLEPNGLCVIGSFILGKGILRRFAKRAAEFPTRFHWFSRDELHRRIERAGFEIVDDSVAGDAITVKARRI